MPCRPEHPCRNLAVPAAPASAALEAQGDFSLEACTGRFEILSRTDNISFESGSARLRPASFPLLDQVADIVNRCPGLNILIAGHTDSTGDAGLNQRLSESRAASVVDYLLGKGVGQGRMASAGYGEDRPVADNATAEGRARNRRIEFSVEGG
ncbi:OmpA family protein [Mangrovicoccus ximenensis]|uniref:OmpA family protein n=1 Tax=Mangrovicoccus ximenensis TaxID=1911570 RepID=UPI001F25B4CE|nr:OmpA family protein [Mangrovicoccus ximenensis]